MKIEITDERFKEFVRFCLVGLAATAIHYGLYLLLVKSVRIEKDWWTNLAYTVGYLISWVCNLFLTAWFTFHEQVSVKKGVGFAASHGVNYVLHILFLNMFIWIGVPKQWAPLPVYSIVVPVNFILVRTVFKRLK